MSSDSITVRVTRGRFDYAHIGVEETQVYVQIPEVARATWLLPAVDFERLRDAEWGDAIDAALTYYAYLKRQGRMFDQASTDARQAVRTWLEADENRDALDAAWFLDAARRHPVSRSLLRDVERLKARVAELEQLLANKDRSADEDPIAYALTDKAAELRSCCAGPVCTCTPSSPQDDEYMPPHDEDVTPQVRKLRGLLAGQRAQTGGAS